MISRHRQPRTWRAASVYLVVLSLEMMILYFTCNFIASLRADVGTMYFEWELSIPLIPWTILPYLSMDLLFAGAPFLAGNRQELRSLAMRLGIAPALASIGFLLVPLKLEFEREPVEGFFGPLFDLLFYFDHPYNLFPSLHVAYGLILWRIYSRHAKGIVNGICHTWFALMFLSTIFTYQHHVLDLAGGLVLGLVIFYLFPDAEPSRDRG